MKVSVWKGGAEGAFHEFEVPRLPSQTVLDVVTYIQRALDPTLAYRYACRVGMCGSCAMTVNGVPRWTCRTHVDKVAHAERLQIGPLKNLPVIRDLVTDMGVIWAAAFGLLYLSTRKSRKAALLLAAVVLSHWFLDLVAHRPDLPLAPGSETRWGLGLWNSIPATLFVEVSLFAAAVFFYTSRTRALDRSGRWGLWALLVFLAAAYVGAAFGPPPPSVEAIAWAGLIGGAVTGFLGYWIDRHRAMAG